MLHIALPDNKTRRLTFYLAMEEYVARHLKAADCFFIWQVEPTVIFGRNQLIDNEVNLDFCRRHNIQTYRRKSGGGCVYADMNNLMLSYITDDEGVGFTFNKYMGMLVTMLHRLGVDAKANGRNDVMLGNRKLSGSAFYRIPGRSILHSTLLYDTNIVNMVGAITPGELKLLSKGVESVRQRIDLLKNHITLNVDELREFAIKHFCDETYCLGEKEIEEIEHIEEEYLTDDFIYGNNPRYTVVKHKRIEGVGEFEVRIDIRHNVIHDVNLMGDYFLIGDLDNGLLKKLRGVPLTRESIRCILPDRIDDIIYNLEKEDFVNLLAG